jgi:putative transposase
VRRSWVDKSDERISVARQCELLGLARSSLYYVAQEESAENLLLMRLLDEEYMRHPFYGAPRLRAWLQTQGHTVNHKRIERLMRQMGIAALYPKRSLSKPAPGHKIYPYLLRGVEIVRADQVWSTDITYVPMQRGFIYLVAIIDWFSRYVIAWEVSATMDLGFCVSALEWGLASGRRPEVFNTDQGAQFTSPQFTSPLLKRSIQISMDGRGRALDNVFIERLWRSVKYEDIYLNDYPSATAAIAGLGRYFRFYNCERPHQALGYLTPQAVYSAKRDTRRIGAQKSREAQA